MYNFHKYHSTTNFRFCIYITNTFFKLNRAYAETGARLPRRSGRKRGERGGEIGVVGENGGRQPAALKCMVSMGRKRKGWWCWTVWGKWVRGGGVRKKEFGKTEREALDNDGVEIRNGEEWIKKKNFQRFA